jgi:hypothetical protein
LPVKRPIGLAGEVVEHNLLGDVRTTTSHFAPLDNHPEEAATLAGRSVYYPLTSPTNSLRDFPTPLVVRESQAILVL